MRVDTIVISGKQGSGKSTLVEAIGALAAVPEKVAVAEVRFASTIYEIHDFTKAVLRSYGIDCPDKMGDLLQYLGTDFGRKNFGDDVWVNCLKERMAKLEGLYSKMGFERVIFLVSDCRFQNEFDALKGLATRVRLQCPKEIRKARCDGWRENDTHISETDLDTSVRAGLFDAVFYTDIEFAHEIAEELLDLLNSRSDQ